MIHFVVNHTVDAESGDLQEPAADQHQVDFVADQTGVFDT